MQLCDHASETSAGNYKLFHSRDEQARLARGTKTNAAHFARPERVIRSQVLDLRLWPDSLVPLWRITLLGKPLLQALAVLHARGGGVEVLGLPGRGAEVANAIRVFEHLRDLFQRLTSSFWEEEVDVDEHRDTEDAEDDVSVLVLAWLSI